MQVGSRQCLLDDGLLGTAVGRGEAIGATVLVHGRAAHQRQNVIPVPFGVGEAFEHHHATAFAAHVAIGGGIERFATAVGRHHARLRKGDGEFWQQQQVDATR